MHKYKLERERERERERDILPSVEVLASLGCLETRQAKEIAEWIGWRELNSLRSNLFKPIKVQKGLDIISIKVQRARDREKESVNTKGRKSSTLKEERKSETDEARNWTYAGAMRISLLPKKDSFMLCKMHALVWIFQQPKLPFWMSFSSSQS